MVTDEKDDDTGELELLGDPPEGIDNLPFEEIKKELLAYLKTGIEQLKKAGGDNPSDMLVKSIQIMENLLAEIDDTFADGSPAEQEILATKIMQTVTVLGELFEAGAPSTKDDNCG